jgi:hypothetical protein
LKIKLLVYNTQDLTRLHTAAVSLLARDWQGARTILGLYQFSSSRKP